MHCGPLSPEARQATHSMLWVRHAKATFGELKSGSERFIAICVSRSKSLPELYIGYVCTSAWLSKNTLLLLRDDFQLCSATPLADPIFHIPILTTPSPARVTEFPKTLHASQSLAVVGTAKRRSRAELGVAICTLSCTVINLST